MARFGITYDEVEQAANALLQQRQNPTIEGVRAALGNTGSFATLSKHLNTWRAHYLVSTVKEPSNNQSTVAPDEVSRAVNQIWEQLTTQAQQQTEKVTKDCEEKITLAIQEKQLFHQEKEDAIHALTQANVKINHLESDVTLLRKELNETQHQRSLAEERAKLHADTLKIVQSETKAILEKFEKMQSDTQQSLMQQLDTIQKSYEEEKDDWKTLVEKQRTDFILELEKQKTAKEKVEKSITKLESELSQRLEQIKKFEEQIRRLEFDLQMSQQQNRTIEKELITCQAEIYQQDKTIVELKEQVGTQQRRRQEKGLQKK
jgi:chromosome segregation ATPase